MDLHDSPEDAAFRAEARHWLEANLTGEFAEARGQGRAGLQHEGRGLRTAWERKLGQDGWTCVAGPSSTADGARPCPNRSSGTRSTSGPTPLPE